MDDSDYETALLGPPGGRQSLFKVSKKAYVDSVLNENKNMDWVKRLYEKNAPSIQVAGEPDKSTHLMADDGKGYVYPTIIRLPNGTLKHLSEDDAYDYARKNNAGIQLPKDEGTWFANNGYKLGTNVNNTISDTGTPFNTPNVSLDKNGFVIYPENSVTSTPVMQRSSTTYVPPLIRH